MSSFTAITVVVRSDSEDSVRDALRHHEDVFYVESADSLPEAFDASEYDEDEDEDEDEGRCECGAPIDYGQCIDPSRH